MKTRLWVHALLIVAMACPTAMAQSDSDKDLMIMIQSLKERVESLEAELAAQKGSGALVERVDAIEEKLETSPAVPKDEDFRVYWKEGLRFDSHDGQFKLKLGGRMHFDAGWFDDSDDFRTIFGDQEDGAEMRRGRLYLSGQVYENYEFKFQYDFAGGDADFKDVWFAYNNIPYIGQVKVGHFKEPFSLEELTSSNYTTFMERALPNVFAPSRNVGIQISNSHWNDRFTWATGVFRETDDFAEGFQDGGYNYSLRLTGLPWVDADSDARFLHAGVSYTHREPDGTVRFRQRPESHMTSTRYVDTGDFTAENIDQWAIESAFVYDRFSLQGEYTMSQVDSPILGDLDFDGWYVQGSVFLTPDHRAFKKSSATFDKVKPNRNFQIAGEERGPGAWEVALRYSELDLTDGRMIGGEEENFTVGLNWYLNPNMRVMFNYINADIDRQPFYAGDLNIFQTRFQASF